MTTLLQIEATCAICGVVGKHTVLGSTNALGSPDLDLRPPEMERSTMDLWLQECPSCGYVAGDIGVANRGEREIVSSESYSSIQSGPNSNMLSGRFQKASMIAEEHGKLEYAARYALWSAWVADDKKDHVAAVFHRSKAANIFLTTISNLDPKTEDSIILTALTVDILRRAERWNEALEMAGSLLAGNLSETVGSVVEFEICLAKNRDSGCYTVADALSNG
jgi:hypothetical protein